MTASNEGHYVRLLDDSIREMLHSAWRAMARVIARKPGAAVFLFRAIRRQQRAARRRAGWERRGTHVPPFMIASITHRCNLQCKGCYARAQHPQAESEMDETKLRGLLSEARDLGMSFVLLAGGEPFTRRDLLSVTRSFPEIIFPVFTNGLLIDRTMAALLKHQRHVIPVISLEGHEGATDDRRGAGVYAHVRETLRCMAKEGIFFGVSITVTCENFDSVTDNGFIQELIDSGCGLFFFVEYVPVREDTVHLVLTHEQQAHIPGIMSGLRANLPALFIAFPGDENEFGGCLAAGRGFVHVSPEGRVEPCPFAPYSDASLKDLTLREALESEFLRAVRESDQLKEDHNGGCVLWEKREIVQSLLTGR